MQEQDGQSERFSDLFSFISSKLEESKLPNSAKEKVKKEIDELKAFTLDARPARIAILGRRGSGKSSLINAIFGEKKANIGSVKAETGLGKWHTFKSTEGELEILDTRGLGEGGKPEGEITEDIPFKEVEKSLKEKCPDAFLFINKAKEVDSRINEDLQQIVELRESVSKFHDYIPPIIGVVTQVDELDPVDITVPPFEDDEKETNIQEAVEELHNKLQKTIGDSPVGVIPICSYMRFKNGTVVHDRRWNINVLIDFIIEQLPKSAQMEFARLSKVNKIQKKIARKIGTIVASITGVLGGNPIPVADLPIITSLQVAMVMTIAIISGRELDKKGVIEFLGALGVNVGVGFALREVARAFVKIIPVAGNYISGGIAYAGTYALCEASIAYFLDGNSIENVKKQYDEEFDKKKNELDTNSDDAV